MKYATVCSGIEAPSVAWHPLGWEPVFFSEIERHACKVLKKRYPAVPNLGDMTKFREWPDYAVDLLAGGTPCQSFSVAGLRKGLADPRGNLSLVFLAIADRYRPTWVAWENVPGVLSNDKGRAFGAFLGGLAELGYGFAYRILDAEFIRVESHPRAVPQRRRRVFVVGYLGDWRRAAAVLFERESVSGNLAPRREAGKEVAGSFGGCSSDGGFRTTDLDNQGAFIPEIAWALQERDSKGADSNTKAGHLIPAVAIAFQPRFARNGRGAPEEIAAALTGEAGTTGKGDSAQCVAAGMAVRRLTPLECLRLQGFPDDYFDGLNLADGPMYKLLGNSMAVNVMRWIGERIQSVQDIPL